MNYYDALVPRSKTIDYDKQNRREFINQEKGNSKGSKRKPKLMQRNKIMQKLFPNYQTIQDKPNECNRQHQLYSFRKQKRVDEQQMFKQLLNKQRQKYQVLFHKYNINQRPSTTQVRQFLMRNKKGTSHTHRL